MSPNCVHAGRLWEIPSGDQSITEPTENPFGSELETILGCAEPRQVTLQVVGESLEPSALLAGRGQHMPVLDHVGWREITKINPDVLRLYARDASDVIHDCQHIHALGLNCRFFDI